MFTLQPNPTFKQVVNIPTTDGESPITFVFKHKGRKALKEFFASLGEGDTARTDLDALQELIETWEGVDVPYDATTLDVLLDNYPAASRVIFEGYNKGLFEGGQKN